MTIYLLDVNLLLALSDPMHIHHESAHRRFAEKCRQFWATSSITET
jgi:predicted nucleic acid-binding protein